jgi:hypothetical protein
MDPTFHGAITTCIIATLADRSCRSDARILLKSLAVCAIDRVLRNDGGYVLESAMVLAHPWHIAEDESNRGAASLTHRSQESTAAPGRGRGGLRVPVTWGVVIGIVQAAAPLAFWWLDAATVYAVSLVLIAAVYIGFAVADGRRGVLGAEIGVATIFVVVATAAVTGSPWLLVAGFLAHGFKDLWQHRRQFVANTRWWPPFCCVVDLVAATIIALEIASGVRFHP